MIATPLLLGSPPTGGLPAVSGLCTRTVLVQLPLRHSVGIPALRSFSEGWGTYFQHFIKKNLFLIFLGLQIITNLIDFLFIEASTQSLRLNS